MTGSYSWLRSIHMLTDIVWQLRTWGGGGLIASGWVYQLRVPHSSLGTGWPIFFVITTEWHKIIHMLPQHHPRQNCNVICARSFRWQHEPINKKKQSVTWKILTALLTSGGQPSKVSLKPSGAMGKKRKEKKNGSHWWLWWCPVMTHTGHWFKGSIPCARHSRWVGYWSVLPDPCWWLRRLMSHSYSVGWNSVFCVAGCDLVMLVEASDLEERMLVEDRVEMSLLVIKIGSEYLLARRKMLVPLTACETKGRYPYLGDILSTRSVI